MRNFNSLFGLTPQEIHAFVIGFFESFPPWEARYIPFNYQPSPVKGEEHYYLAGRGAGIISLGLAIIGLAKLFKEALL